MPTQLALRFSDMPVSCEVQERYHAIAPCLAGKLSAVEQAHALSLSYSTVARWLRQFRKEGIPEQTFSLFFIRESIGTQQNL